MHCAAVKAVGPGSPAAGVEPLGRRSAAVRIQCYGVLVAGNHTWQTEHLNMRFIMFSWSSRILCSVTPPTADVDAEPVLDGVCLMLDVRSCSWRCASVSNASSAVTLASSVLDSTALCACAVTLVANFCRSSFRVVIRAVASLLIQTKNRTTTSCEGPKPCHA